MSKQKDVILNDEIRASEVRCIGDDGTQYNVISRDEALDLAEKAGLDLVMIAPDATPPVCKIMDYGKFKYQQERKLKEAKKKQKIIEIKEIKLSVKIAQNDINYKVKHAREFLEDGKHVKFRVMLRGREMANIQPAIDLLDRIWLMVEDIGEREKAPALEGRFVNIMVFPKKENQK